MIKPSSNELSNTNCLTAFEMNTISTVFIECFESEINKLSLDDKLKIDTFLISFVSSSKLHTLFTAIGLKTITEQVFDNIVIRDFILCLTDQFKCITALSDLESRSIEYSIGYGIGDSSNLEEQLILTPNRIYNSIEKDGKLLYRVLCSNSWLVSLVMIYLFFQRTRLSASISPQNSEV